MGRQIVMVFAGSKIKLASGLYSMAPELEPWRVSLGQLDETELQLSLGTDDARDWLPLHSGTLCVGAYRNVSGGKVDVHPQTGAIGLTLALRGLFSRAIERQGGILVHAAGVSWDGRAALITGVSGAGKSTLARWCVQAGATLLSDEVVGVLPDGTLLGTPFRSDPELQGTPTEARLHLVTTLRHGAFDAVDERPAHELIAAVCEQAFHRERELSAGQVLKCVARALDGVETTQFTCRNAASAGEALRARLLEGGPVGNA